uniref:Putative ovule protein n=1 Tax=Solanum chacoense TaxID=4108 RepID=A0A0V0GU15_SOLCH
MWKRKRISSKLVKDRTALQLQCNFREPHTLTERRVLFPLLIYYSYLEVRVGKDQHCINTLVQHAYNFVH